MISDLPGYDPDEEPNEEPDYQEESLEDVVAMINSKITNG